MFFCQVCHETFSKTSFTCKLFLKFKACIKNVLFYSRHLHKLSNNAGPAITVTVKDQWQLIGWN